MGLDIYLYRYENRQATEELEAQHNEKSEANWTSAGKYDDLTDDVKDRIRAENKAMAVSMGLNEGGDDPRKQCIEIQHPKYPDHYFKIGYFRSSYNGGGINRVLSNLGLPDLYELFNRDNESAYVWAPDWTMCMVRVNEVIEKLRAAPNYCCFEVDANEFSDRKLPATQGEALAIAVAKLKEATSFGEDGFSNIDGHFFPNGIKVFALLPGQRQSIFGALHKVDAKRATTYVVTESENEWYVQALEIVRDTIQYVIDQPDKDKYFLHWSS